MKKLIDIDAGLAIQQCSDVLHILSSPKRVHILLILSEGEQSAKELMYRLNSSQSGISQHLAKMRDGGIVSTRRYGLFVRYRLAMPEIKRLLIEVEEFLKLGGGRRRRYVRGLEIKRSR